MEENEQPNDSRPNIPKFDPVSFPVIPGIFEKMLNLEEVSTEGVQPSSSNEIQPGSEGFNNWQEWRERTVFPTYRNDLRKKMASLAFCSEGLRPDLGYVMKMDFDLAKDVFPEEYAMLENLLNSLHNKLHPNKTQYPTNIKPRYGPWTDSKAKPAGEEWQPTVTPWAIYERNDVCRMSAEGECTWDACPKKNGGECTLRK